MSISRRQFLRAAGVAIALPPLESLARVRSAEPRRRMVCICAPLGLHPAYLLPQQAGRDYAITPYLEVVQEFRKDFTIVSGLSHPGLSPGSAHQASASFLTGAPGAGRPGFRNSISLDQLVAESIGDQTRFRSLVLAGEGGGLSWTRTGAQVPAESLPSKVFARLFLADSAEEIRERARQLSEGRSALDDVSAKAKALQGSLGHDDREKLDEYLTSVRELEKRLTKDELWFRKPKPKVDAAAPKDVLNAADLLGRTRLLFDLTVLALQSDSTRLVTIMLGGSTFAPPIQGVTLGHHDLSHHGKDPGKLDQLKIVEVEQMKLLKDMLARLSSVKEDGASVLDRTMVYLGSNLGDGSSHSIKNLPVFLAGGGFKHGQHLAFDPQTSPPLCNFYVSLLQRFGLPVDKFGTATGTLTGLEMAG
ncbi:MAG TPA: DUF1552 domain-containing protein [Planctomycetota bacterium]|nr:DUF1552 domain-containing protein [Planctomycetota bacterium]